MVHIIILGGKCRYSRIEVDSEVEQHFSESIEARLFPEKIIVHLISNSSLYYKRKSPSIIRENLFIKLMCQINLRSEREYLLINLFR